MSERLQPDPNDELLGDAIKIVRETGKYSPTLLQRRLRIGYGRAAYLIELIQKAEPAPPAPPAAPPFMLVTPEMVAENNAAFTELESKLARAESELEQLEAERDRLRKARDHFANELREVQYQRAMSRKGLVTDLLSMWDGMASIHPELARERDIAVEWLTKTWPVVLPEPAPAPPAPPAAPAVPPAELEIDRLRREAAAGRLNTASLIEQCEAKDCCIRRLTDKLARAESELEDKTAHVERLCADLRELQAELASTKAYMENMRAAANSLATELEQVKAERDQILHWLCVVRS